MKIRRMSPSDLPQVLRIQGECYDKGILESVDSFSAKLSAVPEFCFIALQGEKAVGYVISLPWAFGGIPALNGTEYTVPASADSLCIHDLAVAPTARKAGVARHLLEAVFDTARHQRYRQIFLVAVQGASSFWKCQGFEIMQADEMLQRSLSAYGADAEFMVKTEAHF